MARVVRNFGKKYFLCALVPECQLRFARAKKIAEHLVMVLRCAAFFDDVPLPWNFWIELWIRIFPPPDLAALPVAAEHKVWIAVAIHVKNRASRFDGQKIRLNDIPFPIRSRPPVPDQRGSSLPETEHKIIRSVPVQIGDQRTGLLRRG